MRYFGCGDQVEVGDCAIVGVFGVDGCTETDLGDVWGCRMGVKDCTFAVDV